MTAGHDTQALYSFDQQAALYRLQDAVMRCVELDVSEDDIDVNVGQAMQFALDERASGG